MWESPIVFHADRHHPEQNLDLQIRALDKKANKIEKMKNKKGGQAMWSEVHELGQLIRYAGIPINYLTAILSCFGYN